MCNLLISFTSGLDYKEFDLNKYTSNSSNECVLDVDLEYPKELRELQTDYPLAPDKIEMKKEILSEYQLKTTYLCNIPISCVRKWFLTFLIKRSMCFIMCFILQTSIKTKTIQWLKPFFQFSKKEQNQKK